MQIKRENGINGSVGLREWNTRGGADDTGGKVEQSRCYQSSQSSLCTKCRTHFDGGTSVSFERYPCPAPNRCQESIRQTRCSTSSTEGRRKSQSRSGSCGKAGSRDSSPSTTSSGLSAAITRSSTDTIRARSGIRARRSTWSSYIPRT